MITGSESHYCVGVRFLLGLEHKSIIWLLPDLPVSYSMLNIELNPSLAISWSEVITFCYPVSSNIKV